MNRKDSYVLTDSPEALAKAFKSYEGLAEYLENLFTTIRNSAELDEYILMRELFAEAYENGAMVAVAVPDPQASEANAKAFIKAVKTVSGDMVFANSNNNAYLEAQNGGRQRGGSTITQQTAKNVFLWPQSSWIRKGFEAYFTVLIELFWSKERIMEVYLNSIEMGDGIYGAEAVAQIHFGTSAKKLTRQQSAMIAASLPNPLKFNSAKPTPYMYKRQKWIIRQMKHLGKFPTK
jgi:monofunctional biosynthetic peptidoglycan transglycosylase